MKNNRFVGSKLLKRSLLAIFFLVFVALLALSGSRVSSQTSTPTPPPQANNEAKPVSRLIDDAKRAGRDFPIVEPFNRQTRSAAADVARRRAVRAGTILQLRSNALAELVGRNAQSLTLRLPSFTGPPVELELVQVNLFAPGFNVKTSDSGVPVTYEHGMHYWGVIKGVEDSLATISIFKDEVMGTFSSAQQGNFVLGKLAGNNPARDHILYAEKDLTSTLSISCETPDDNTAFSPDQLDDSSTTQAVTRCVKVFIEADYDLFLNRGSVNATVNFVTGVFNQSAALYSNEGIPISISEIVVWTSPSPYNGGSSDVQLDQFQGFRTSFNGDVAHLVDLQSNQGGIAAGFNGFCNPDRSQSQCYSGIDPFFNDVPTYSWTVYVFTHEMGHLFGSRHTHACVWNGNGTAIDGCSGFTEGGCPLPGIPSNGGTIMSYCHLQSVGINFSLGFGPQPGSVIRNQFNGAGCVGTCGDPQTQYYEVVARHSGKCLDVSGESMDIGALVIQWVCGGWFNQQWEIIPVGDGYYKFVARHSGKVLDVQWGALDNGTPVWQWDENGTPAQQWEIIDVGDGYVRIMARHSGKALDVSGVSFDDGAQIHQWDYVGGGNQQWWLRPIP